LIEPCWAKRAANGAWYHIVSKPFMPVAQLACTPVAQWAATRTAIAIEP
jgi:hypothetical protein